MMRSAIELLCVLIVLRCNVPAAFAAERITVVATDGGSVTVNNTSPADGEVVTLTVTPSDGYEISKANIIAEATIDPGSAHAPRIKETGPDVGLYIELIGNDPSDLGQERTYTLTMPESPLNVLINATFTSSTITNVDVIRASSDIDVGTVHYFNLQGHYIGTSLNGVIAGVYITDDGKKIIKRQ